jgi:hypothetical protein
MEFKILDQVESFKEKLTDAEYKALADTLMESFREKLVNSDVHDSSDSDTSSESEPEVIRPEPRQIMRPKTAYLHFCRQYRSQAMEKLGEGAKNTHVTCQLSTMWNELRNDPARREELESFIKLASEDRQRYEREVGEQR